MFSAYGLLQQLVSNNDPQFTSSEFATFCAANSIKHVRTPPYHPSSNGLAKWFVQSFKIAVKKADKDGLSLFHRLGTFLFSYCTMPHATTNMAPCMLFLGQSFWTQLYLLSPDPVNVVADHQATQMYRANWSWADTYIAESITTDAGRFGHVCLCQLCTKLRHNHRSTTVGTTNIWALNFRFVCSWQRPMWPKCPALVVIDSVTYLLTISSPDIDNVAMSLYNITQKMQHDRHSGARELHIGQRVMVRDFLHSTKGVEGTIFKCLGPVPHLIKLPCGVKWKQHIDHNRARAGTPHTSGGEEGASSDDFGSVAQEMATHTHTPWDHKWPCNWLSATVGTTTIWNIIRDYHHSGELFSVSSQGSYNPWPL